MSAAFARFDWSLPVMVIMSAPNRLRDGVIASNSSLSPEFDRAITTSSSVIMPRSPWLASAGCMKNAGVPVLANVEAILLAMCPDLPIPVMTTLPLQFRMIETALENESFKRLAKFAISADSSSNTSRASDNIFVDALLILLVVGDVLRSDIESE